MACSGKLLKQPTFPYVAYRLAPVTGQADKCVLVQLAVPSRRDVPEYQRLQRQVHELVGQISGTGVG